MIILDFLFYYLTFWFNKNKGRLEWSTSLQRSSYAIGLATISFVYAISEFFEFTILKDTAFLFPKFLFVFLALGIMWVYDFIYIKKNRYDSINKSSFGFLKNIEDMRGVTISISIIAFCILLPFLIMMIFIPFGGHRLTNTH